MGAQKIKVAYLYQQTHKTCLSLTQTPKIAHWAPQKRKTTSRLFISQLHTSILNFNRIFKFQLPNSTFKFLQLQISTSYRNFKFQQHIQISTSIFQLQFLQLQLSSTSNFFNSKFLQLYIFSTLNFFNSYYFDFFFLQFQISSTSNLKSHQL